MIDPRHKSAADTVRAALRKLSEGRNRLNPKNIQDRLMTASKLDSVKLKEGLNALREAGEITSDSWDDYHGTPLAQMTLDLEPEEQPEHVAAWQSLVDGCALPESARIALRKSKVAAKFQDMPLEDQKRLLDQLLALVENQGDVPEGTSLFEAGARSVIGSSKVLGTLGGPLLQQLGLRVERFTKGPRYLAVAGPSEPQAVVLVENPHSFESAVQAGTLCAFACTYGFGLPIDLTPEILLEETLAKQSASINRLVRAGDPPPTARLLEHPRLFFWGDLDLAGMRIYDSLKKKLPLLRLSALYAPMIKALREGHCHPYIKAVGKNGQKEQHIRQGPLSDPMARQMADLCAEQAVDQEYVHEGYAHLAHLSLEEVTLL